jgi:hypothetical protein
VNRHSWAPAFRAGFRRVFSFPVLLGATLALGAFVMTSPAGANKLFLEGDVWWHAAVGQRILSSGHFPTADTYSFTVHGQPWMAYEWLGEVVMALAARFSSLQGLQILFVLLTTALVLLTYCYAWVRTGNHLASAAAVALLMLVEQAGFTLRPQMIGYVFLMITLISLDLFKQGRLKSLWFLPILFCLWVNTHSSFVVGLVVVACYGAGGLVGFQWGNLVADRWDEGKRRHLLRVSLLSLLALLLTPYGPRLAAYPFEFMFMQPLNVMVNSEWSQLDFSVSWGLAFLFIVLAWIVAQIICPIIYRVEIIAPLLLVTYVSFLHGRFLLLFVAMFAPILATFLGQWLPSYDAAMEHYTMNAVFIAALLCGSLALWPSNTRLQGSLRRAYPVGAVEYLRAHPVPSSMFNDENWGGFLIWSLAPEHKVFMDGRLDIYEYAGVLADYVSIMRVEQNAPMLLRKYGIVACLLRRDATLVGVLAASHEWEKVYEDDHSVIFLRAGDAAREKGHSEKK